MRKVEVLVPIEARRALHKMRERVTAGLLWVLMKWWKSTKGARLTAGDKEWAIPEAETSANDHLCIASTASTTDLSAPQQIEVVGRCAPTVINLYHKFMDRLFVEFVPAEKAKKVKDGGKPRCGPVGGGANSIDQYWDSVAQAQAPSSEPQPEAMNPMPQTLTRCLLWVYPPDL